MNLAGLDMFIRSCKETISCVEGLHADDYERPIRAITVNKEVFEYMKSNIMDKYKQMKDSDSMMLLDFDLMIYRYKGDTATNNPNQYSNREANLMIQMNGMLSYISGLLDSRDSSTNADDSNYIGLIRNVILYNQNALLKSMLPGGNNEK